MSHKSNSNDTVDIELQNKRYQKSKKSPNIPVLNKYLKPEQIFSRDQVSLSEIDLNNIPNTPYTENKDSPDTENKDSPDAENKDSPDTIPLNPAIPKKPLDIKTLRRFLPYAIVWIFIIYVLILVSVFIEMKNLNKDKHLPTNTTNLINTTLSLNESQPIFKLLRGDYQNDDSHKDNYNFTLIAGFIGTAAICILIFLIYWCIKLKNRRYRSQLQVDQYTQI